MMEDKVAETSLIDWADRINVGVPTMVLLPAFNYRFRTSKNYVINIPRRGKYSEVAPDVPEGTFGKNDSFELYDENSVMDLPTISKILFATKQYPSLENGQFFAPILLVFKEDTVDILGQIVELVDPGIGE
jgi:hypothetical protein